MARSILPNLLLAYSEEVHGAGTSDLSMLTLILDLSLTKRLSVPIPTIPRPTTRIRIGGGGLSTAAEDMVGEWWIEGRSLKGGGCLEGREEEFACLPGQKRDG